MKMHLALTSASAAVSISATAPQAPVAVLAAAARAPPVSSLSPSALSTGAKHRLIVLSDIDADPDDTQSFIRLFLYASQIDIEGLAATTSTHMRTAIHPDSIQRTLQIALRFLRGIRLSVPAGRG